MKGGVLPHYRAITNFEARFIAFFVAKHLWRAAYNGARIDLDLCAQRRMTEHGRFWVQNCIVAELNIRTDVSERPN